MNVLLNQNRRIDTVINGVYRIITKRELRPQYKFYMDKPCTVVNKRPCAMKPFCKEGLTCTGEEHKLRIDGYDSWGHCYSNENFHYGPVI
jgi:hypothetical protein